MYPSKYKEIYKSNLTLVDDGSVFLSLLHSPSLLDVRFFTEWLINSLRDELGAAFPNEDCDGAIENIQHPSNLKGCHYQVIFGFSHLKLALLSELSEKLTNNSIKM